VQLRTTLQFVIIYSMAAALLTGCARKPKPEPLSAEAMEQQLLAAVDQAFNDARGLLNEGRTNDALARITGVANDPRYRKFRNNTLAGLVQFLLYIEKTDEAKRLVAQACAQEPEHVVGAIDVLHDYLVNRGDVSALAAWAAGLAAIPALPASLQYRLMDWRVSAALSLQDLTTVENLLAQSFRTLAPAESIALATRILNAHIEGNRLEAAARILTQLSSVQPQTPELIELVTRMQVLLTAARGDWDALPAAFASASGSLADQPLLGLMNQILALARKAGRYRVADGICEEILFRQPAKTNTRSLAARSWAENAMTTNRVDLSRRLNGLIEAKVPANEVGMIFQRYYYELINEPALLKAMCGVGETLLPLLSKEETLKSVKTMLLDGAFVLEDYDAAVQRLEAGIPGRDESWHKMALAKVKAHRALKNNQPREAVQFFRDFMVCVQTVKDEDTSDPSTGIQHSKEMIIGRNAKRIAEILATIPDPAAAAQAYQEARGYYATALEKANPETRKIIEAEMALLPKP
jgi:hypothetical protein